MLESRIYGRAAFIAATAVSCSNAEARIEACQVSGVPKVVCLRVEVPESPSAPAGRKIHVKVVVLPALGPQPHREPLVLIQGGPGVAGSLMARNFAPRQVLRDRRALVFFDQRGTAGSGALSCAFLGRDNFLGALFPADHVSACRRALSRRANLAAYTNSTSAEDLEAIRKALGAETWSLAGYSFGTRLAQTYARRYPNRVRAVVLDGVVPFDADLTADLAPAMERSLDYVMTRCEKSEECRAHFPDTKQALVRIATRLEKTPVAIQVTDTAGRTLSGSFTRWDFAYAVRGMLYGPLAAFLPSWVQHAERTGDFSAFAQVYWQRSRWVGDSTSLALHLGVYCSEDLPFIDSTKAARRAQGTLIGPRYYQEYRAGCASWPMPRAVAEMRTPWKSDIPVLLLSGERDPVTPPEYGERVARSLTRSRHIVIRGGGHAEQSPCKTQVVASFLSNPLEGVPDKTCLDLLDFPPFTLSR